MLPSQPPPPRKLPRSKSAHDYRQCVHREDSGTEIFMWERFYLVYGVLEIVLVICQDLRLQLRRKKG
jgi:hypothetical protein